MLDPKMDVRGLQNRRYFSKRYFNSLDARRERRGPMYHLTVGTKNNWQGSILGSTRNLEIRMMAGTPTVRTEREPEQPLFKALCQRSGCLALPESITAMAADDPVTEPRRTSGPDRRNSSIFFRS